MNNSDLVLVEKYQTKSLSLRRQNCREKKS